MKNCLLPTQWILEHKEKRLCCVDEIKNRVKQKNAKAGLVLTSDVLTNGKGSLQLDGSQKSWFSIPGNLKTLMLIDTYHCGPHENENDFLQHAGELEFVGALAVLSAISSFFPPEQQPEHVWGNGVIALRSDNVWGKIAGTLFEPTDDSHLWIIGAGINIVASPPLSAMRAGSAFPPASFKECGIMNVSQKDVLERLIEEMEKSLLLWQNLGLVPILYELGYTSSLDDAMLTFEIGSELLTGEFIDRDGDENMRVRLANQEIRTFQCYEIKMKKSHKQAFAT